MVRQGIAPSPRTKNIINFLGMVRDRKGTSLRHEEFRTLSNVDNILAQSLQKRKGAQKYGAVVDADGSAVRGGMTFTDISDVITYLKIANQQISQFQGGSWATIGAAIFTDTTTAMRQLMTQKTGASADVTGTSTSEDFTSMTDSGASFTVNAHVGKILSINGEKKVIIGNTATVIQLAERFDDVPPNGTYNIYPRAQEVFVANGFQFYKTDLTTLTQLDNVGLKIAYNGIELHDNRLWGWSKNRLHWSDVGNGEQWARNSWKDFSSNITCAVDFAEILVIYEPKKVTVKMNDTPDTFIWRTTLAGYGTSAPRSVATFPGYQLFLDDVYGVMMIHLKDITIRALTPYGDEVEPISVSLDYINTLIYAHSATERAAAVGFFHDGNYHLRIGSDVFVLHFQASLDSRPMFASGPAQNGLNWIWSIRSYPDAILPSWIGEYDNLVYGSYQSGQVYSIDKDDVFDDDGTSITQTIEKCDWDLSGAQVPTGFDAMYGYQPVPDDSATYNAFFAPGGETFQSIPDLTWDPTVDSTTFDLANHRSILKIPSNASDAGGKKDSGILFSYKFTETSSVLCTNIENIEIHFYPGILS